MLVKYKKSILGESKITPVTYKLFMLEFYK